jgi:hypothetical protein
MTTPITIHLTPEQAEDVRHYWDVEPQFTTRELPEEILKLVHAALPEPPVPALKPGDIIRNANGSYGWTIEVLGVWEGRVWAKHSAHEKPHMTTEGDLQAQLKEGHWVLDPHQEGTA